jgi:hypothetical protein
VFRLVRVLKECGTAFLRMPAIQFSKTERFPGSEALASSPDPDRHVSRRQRACVWGEWDPAPLPGSVRALPHEDTALTEGS